MKNVIKMKRIAPRALAGLFLILALMSPPGALEAREGWPVIVDSHLHFLDFTQRTDGFEALTRAMDEAGVEKAVIFGMPLVKMWSESDPIRPAYYLDTDSAAYYYSATDYILADELARAYAGHTVVADDLYRRHHLGTPYIRRNYADALNLLVTRGRAVRMGARIRVIG